MAEEIGSICRRGLTHALLALEADAGTTGSGLGSADWGLGEEDGKGLAAFGTSAAGTCSAVFNDGSEGFLGSTLVF
jgi:hypothetical protein